MYPSEEPVMRDTYITHEMVAAAAAVMRRVHLQTTWTTHFSAIYRAMQALDPEVERLRAAIAVLVGINERAALASTNAETKSVVGIGDLPERLFAHSLELVSDEEEDEPSQLFLEAQEAARLLAELRGPLDYHCPRCSGDCSAANPPVMDCPMHPSTPEEQSK